MDTNQDSSVPISQTPVNQDIPLKTIPPVESTIPEEPPFPPVVPENNPSVNVPRETVSAPLSAVPVSTPTPLPPVQPSPVPPPQLTSASSNLPFSPVPPPTTAPLNIKKESGSSKIFLKIIFIVLGILVLGGLAFLGKTYFLDKKSQPVKQIEITYWGLFEKPQAIQQVIADYEVTHPNVKINYTEENLFEYRERLQKRLTEGGPDIFRIHQSWIPMLGSFLSPVPVTAYTKEDFEKIFYPSAKESLSFQGKYVALPLMIDGLALYYNEDIFKAAGKIPPTSWDELRKSAIELTVRNNEGKIVTAGAAMGTTGNIDHWSDIVGLLMLQNGADLSNPGACSKGSLESGSEDVCPGADALSFYTILSRNDRVWDSTMPSSTFAFAQGYLAMYFGPSWRALDIKNLNPNINFKTIPVPQLPGRNISWSSYWAEAVNKNSKNQTEIWEFLKYLSTPEVLQKLYQNQMIADKNREFGEPYPRTDMDTLLKDQPIVGAYIQQAPYSKNWYLSSATKDNGINEQMISYYKQAVDSVNEGREDAVSALKTITAGITQVLSKYTQLPGSGQ